MSSSHSENHRAELNGSDPKDEEYTPVPVQIDAVYEPGPSFLEHDRPTVRLAELPAWLQRFAASTGDPDDAGYGADQDQSGNITHLPAPSIEAAPEPEIEPDVDFEVAAEHQEPSIELPSWLNDDATEDEPTFVEPELPEAPAAVEPPLPGSPQFMISEDDLPEWLRSISPEDGGDAAVGLGAAEQVAASGVASVPSVARAWVTRDEMEALSEGGSLFALVASQTSTTSVVETPDPSPAPATGRRGRATTDTQSTEQVGPATAGKKLVQAESEPAPDDAESEERKFRLFPILVGSLLVIIIVLIAMNFL